MASPVLDTGAFTPAELQSMLTAAKTEYLQRMTGRVQTGSSAAQSYGLTLMSTDELTRYINAISTALGFDSGTIIIAQPNFNSTAPGLPQSSYFGY